MGFTVPNDGTAGDRQQEELHESDLLILAAGHNGYGVVSGCAVSAQGTPDMTVAVASGTAKVGGTNVTVSAGNVTITADGSNPRYVLIEVDSAGAKSANAGTAAANPTKPTPSSTKTVLAEVYVPAGDTAIGAAQIVDKRVLLGASGPQLLGRTEYDPASQTDITSTTTSFADVDATNLSLSFTTPADGVVDIILYGSGFVSTTVNSFWNLRNGAADVADSECAFTGATTYTQAVVRKIRLTLTGSTAYTLKWGWKASSAATLRMRVGGDYGPALMEAWST